MRLEKKKKSKFLRLCTNPRLDPDLMLVSEQIIKLPEADPGPSRFLGHLALPCPPGCLRPCPAASSHPPQVFSAVPCARDGGGPSSGWFAERRLPSGHLSPAGSPDRPGLPRLAGGGRCREEMARARAEAPAWHTPRCPARPGLQSLCGLRSQPTAQLRLSPRAGVIIVLRFSFERERLGGNETSPLGTGPMPCFSPRPKSHSHAICQPYWVPIAIPLETQEVASSRPATSLLP